jgi:hypothetical protein
MSTDTAAQSRIFFMLTLLVAVGAFYIEIAGSSGVGRPDGHRGAARILIAYRYSWRMRSFCIVVQRGHEDLFDALKQAFRSRPGFYVVIDRRNSERQAGRRRGGRERRGGGNDWGNAHFLVAESVEPFGGSSK